MWLQVLRFFYSALRASRFGVFSWNDNTQNLMELVYFWSTTSCSFMFFHYYYLYLCITMDDTQQDGYDDNMLMEQH